MTKSNAVPYFDIFDIGRLEVKPAVVGDTKYCTDCKNFFTDFKTMITDKTEQVSCLFMQSRLQV